MHRRAPAKRQRLLRIRCLSAGGNNESQDSFACMGTPPPPILVSFRSFDDLLEALPVDGREEHRQELQRLYDKVLPPVISISILSVLFGLSASFIASMLRRPNKHYRHFIIRKGRKRREIYAPKVGLKLFQRWIGHHLAEALNYPDCVLGFVPHKSGVFSAANTHCSARWVYSLDLKDFFSQVTGERLSAPLIDLGYSQKSTSIILKICLFNGFLPQGSPASPVLSNLAFEPTDRELSNLAKQHGVRYTRYADDLVFSGEALPPEGFEAQIKEILAVNNWEIAKEKEHFAALPARLKVHGLLVHGARPRLTKGYRNKIRAYRHLLNTGRVKPGDLARVKGHVSYSDCLDHFVENGAFEPK
ncbi:reverse transcriptase family protein [Aquipseudomonas alcaligenes]|uniref:RNA-directed DNA polymerase n=1 Tax=Aquipseudomonas alcaligenes TaxID=43263 RepID=A0AB73I5Q9_AQUAC|nr:reverse transcriptase family protein [Pseudomonas alcaligenes]MDH0144695.1 reverse transcriptase family protein [Pseudomonas alcaligenes]